MTPVSGMDAGGVRPLNGAEKTLSSPAAQRTGEKARLLEPAEDGYIPEEKHTPSGRYWMGRDGDGRPQIYFDAPEEPEDAPPAGRVEEAPGGGAPRQPEEARGPGRDSPPKERCVADTSKVDREIKRLKEKQQELERQLAMETDPARIKELERRMARINREVSEKDNDTYRRRHTRFS